jgi:uncharacterized protein (TIGR02246 family)
MKRLILFAILSAAMHTNGQVNVVYPESAAVPDSVLLDLVRQVDDAWNSRDIEWFSSLFTEDCDIQYITLGRTIQSREGVHGSYSESFKKIPPEVRHLTYPDEIIWLETDLCMGTGHTDIVSLDADGNEQKLLYKHDGLMVFRLTPQGWKVQLIRAWTEIPKAEP